MSHYILTSAHKSKRCWKGRYSGIHFKKIWA